MWPLVFLLCFIQGFGVEGVTWKITIVTSDKDNAGTDSDIYLTLHGSLGSSAETKLESDYNNFERNQRDIFFVTTDDIGKVCSVTIRSAGNNANADWHLQRIEVEGSSQKIFWCHCLLSKKEGYQRELQPTLSCYWQ